MIPRARSRASAEFLAQPGLPHLARAIKHERLALRIFFPLGQLLLQESIHSAPHKHETHFHREI